MKCVRETIYAQLGAHRTTNEQHKIKRSEVVNLVLHIIFLTIIIVLKNDVSPVQLEKLTNLHTEFQGNNIHFRGI